MTHTEFRAALKSLGLRQSQLAERLGVHRSTVCHWAAGTAAVPKYVAYVLELLAERGVTAWTRPRGLRVITAPRP